jgi:D-glycero-alpha-D-manno-heptose-7-phosphate kinase
MIITRTPLRITLAGGGTDLPEFYSKFGGSVTSMAIDKYIYVTFKKTILEKIVKLRYLKTEEVDNINKLSNERARVSLKKFNIENQCELTSMADLPSNSGLGSSGTYLVGVINTLQKYRGKSMSKKEIADLACYLEMVELGEPVGKQDQFIASFGGIKTFNIDKSGEVAVENFFMENGDVSDFIERNRIYFTGVKRDASDVLKKQVENKNNFEDRMKRIQELSFKFLEALKDRRFDDYGSLLNEHWQQKKGLSNSVSISKVDKIYDELLQEKLILGGKIIGAGGGGFLWLYSHKNHEELDNKMTENGFTRIEYNLDRDGTKIIYDR